MNAETPEVACVICARNEEHSIRRVVEGARLHVDEVMVMDGHSGDATRSIAKEAGATVHLDPGLGKGSGIRRSFTLTDAQILVFIDADGSHDPNDIPRLVEPVARRELDLCVGSRFSGGSDELSVSLPQLVRTIGNISMNIAINWRWKTELTDTLNGFRAGRRDALLAADLRENRHTIELEMIMKMLRAGFRVGNVSSHEYRREYGHSHINVWLEWPRFVWCVAANLFQRGSQPSRGTSEP